MLPHLYHNTPLQPWNVTRERLALALDAAARDQPDALQDIDASLDALAVIEEQTRAILARSAEAAGTLNIDEHIEWSRFHAAAARTLWLAHHDTATARLQAAQDMPALLRSIEAWADENIPDEDLLTAVRLAALLRTGHRQFLGLPRPPRHASAEVPAGN